MGCMLSRPVPVAQQPRPVDPTQKNPGGNILHQISNNSIPHLADYQLITSDIRSICKIEGTNPIVCLDESSFPIVASKLFLDADNPTDISLPVVAASDYGNGRVLCFGHIGIFSEQYRNTGDTEIFLSASFQWAMQKSTSTSRSVLIIGFPAYLIKCTKNLIQQFSLVPEVFETNGDEDVILIDQPLGDYYMILAASNVCFDIEEITQFVEAGGILICVFSPPNYGTYGVNINPASPASTMATNTTNATNNSNINNINMNITSDGNIPSVDNSNASNMANTNNMNTTATTSNLNNNNNNNCSNYSGIDEQTSFAINHAIIPMGLAFAFCSLLVGEPKSFRFEVRRRFVDVMYLTFQDTIDTYINYIQGEVEETKLDDLVTSLRFYLMVIGDNHQNSVSLLVNETWTFLNNTGLICEKGIAPQVIHGICMILLTQLLYKVPFSKFDAFDKTDFPGDSGEIELSNHNLHLSIGSFAWFSTGLWLPKGKIGKIRIKTPMPFLHVQIGSHQDSLLSKAGPWKRFPVVIMSYPLDQLEFEISSPFGGIIYIVAEMLPDPTLSEVDIEFEGFGKHPQAIMEQPNVWKETKNLDVPWTELESSTFILTVPTKFLKEHESDIDSYFNIFDRLINEIMTFTSCNLIRPYRIVFDIELVNDEPGCSYPLVFSLDDLERILVVEQPTKQLFTLMTILTNISVRENCFDLSTETAIATVSACSAIKSVWPNSNPLVFLEGDTPGLFNELWDLHIHYDSTVLPKTLAVFQDPEFQIIDTPEDMWILFVRELCRIGKKNFTPALQRARPIPLNISISLQNLPDYKGCDQS
ncbi:hypothetical protein TRFO_29622 [Tritrichomonas foetus]|uniref:Peptidase M60 domain-containing protein n=1 Tax=Tritrichomonas foetus TaxID=1144522 RepID=A0A1J4JZZ5_9EUKA|nr:hypothetical protein TRFO_29622 [Tritrichomonas foetus]|eukprot:OHT03062.1 hypothetical protein TRFO_29622 [Tritrichomonas foetus]